MKVFEFKDTKGKVIYLTSERLEHINREHPEIMNYFRDLSDSSFVEVFSKPTKVVDYDDRVRYYYKNFKDREEKPRYLLVIVKYLNGEGFIITMYFVRGIK